MGKSDEVEAGFSIPVYDSFGLSRPAVKLRPRTERAAVEDAIAVQGEILVDVAEKDAAQPMASRQQSGMESLAIGDSHVNIQPGYVHGQDVVMNGHD
jgi:hypothetical protein